LGIGVGCDELDAVHPFMNHVLDGIATCPTDPENLDDRAALFFLLDDLKHGHYLL
jgi:hypothetical protein